jgi:hypothetical protein
MPDWQEQAAGMPHAKERAIAPITPRPATPAVVTNRICISDGVNREWHERRPRGNENGHAALVDKVRIAKDEWPPMPAACSCRSGMPERDGVRMKPHRFGLLFEHDLQLKCARLRAKSRPPPRDPDAGRFFRIMPVSRLSMPQRAPARKLCVAAHLPRPGGSR